MMNKPYFRHLLTLLPVFFLLLFMPSAVRASGQQEVTMSVEKFTIGQGYIVEPSRVELNDNDTAAMVFDRLMRSKGLTYQCKGTLTDSFYMSQIDNGDNGKYVVPAAIKAMGDFVTSGGDHITPPTGKEVNVAFPDLSEFSYMQSAGWMYTVKGKNVSEKALSDYYPEDGDVIRIQFTLYGYGADLGLVYDDEDFPLKLPDRDAMTERLSLMNKYKTKLMTDSGFRQAYNRAMELIVNLNTSETLMNQAMAALPTEEQIAQYLEIYDANVVAMVIENIDSIGEVTDTSQEALILSTKEAYENLSPSQKAEVGTERESKLYSAAAAIRSMLDQIAADEVAVLINAVGTVTLEKESEIQIIDNMIGNLSEGALSCLSNADKVTFADLKNQLAILKAQYQEDIRAANAIVNRIYAIGPVALTKASRIRNIRKDYDALTDGAKAVIPESIYKILIDAEAELAVLEQKEAAGKEAEKPTEETAASLAKKYTPAKIVQKAPKPGKKKVKLSWKKIGTATGYQVFMSAKKSSGFKKIATIKKAKTVTFTKKKLKSKKTYYFRIRAYRTVGKKTYYGAYSTVKKVKVK